MSLKWTGPEIFSSLDNVGPENSVPGSWLFLDDLNVEDAKDSEMLPVLSTQDPRIENPSANAEPEVAEAALASKPGPNDSSSSKVPAPLPGSQPLSVPQLDINDLPTQPLPRSSASSHPSNPPPKSVDIADQATVPDPATPVREWQNTPYTLGSHVSPPKAPLATADNIVIPDSQLAPGQSFSRSPHASASPHASPSPLASPQPSPRPSPSANLSPPSPRPSPRRSPAAHQFMKPLARPGTARLRPVLPSRLAEALTRAPPAAGEVAPPHWNQRPVPVGLNTALRGQVFIITGVLDSLTRTEATQLIHNHGGVVAKSLSARVTAALVGFNPGPNKVREFEQRSLRTFSEPALFLFLTDSLPDEINSSSKRQRVDPDGSHVELPDSIEPATPDISLFSTQNYRRVVRFNRPPSALLLPLVCPLSGTRLRIPIRGSRCQHTHAFNKKHFLDLCVQEWAECPFCLRRIGVNDIVFDESIAEILALTTPTTLQVRLQPDGTFEPVDLYQEQGTSLLFGPGDVVDVEEDVAVPEAPPPRLPSSPLPSPSIVRKLFQTSSEPG